MDIILQGCICRCREIHPTNKPNFSHVHVAIPIEYMHNTRQVDAYTTLYSR